MTHDAPSAAPTPTGAETLNRRKVYVTGAAPRCGSRSSRSPVAHAGARAAPNAPVRLYDTSGPGSDPDVGLRPCARMDRGPGRRRASTRAAPPHAATTAGPPCAATRRHPTRSPAAPASTPARPAGARR